MVGKFWEGMAGRDPKEFHFHMAGKFGDMHGRVLLHYFPLVRGIIIDPLLPLFYHHGPGHPSAG
jgi:hypothetical protein